MTGREEGFLGRWSRRKRAASGRRAGTAETFPQPAPDLSAPPAPEPAAAAAPSAPGGAPACDPASLPPVESMTNAGDLAAIFLRPGVPAALRHAALRRLWSLDPAIRDFVGPAEYAWDFNAPDGVPGFSPTLTGDIARLLAQATGTEAAPDRETRSDPIPEAAVPKTLPPPDPAASATLPEIAEAPPAVPAGDGAPQAAERAAPGQRRHGGALPV